MKDIQSAVRFVKDCQEMVRRTKLIREELKLDNPNKDAKLLLADAVVDLATLVSLIARDYYGPYVANSSAVTA